MTSSDLFALCEQGQEQLMAMQYLQAEATLVRAERQAWAARDFDSLARLYMPLQETRRQRRQRCGEGVVRLDLLTRGEADPIDARRVLEDFPHGQLLIAGWGSIQPALEVRRLAAERGLYVETFLAAVYPIGEGRAVVIVPRADVALPKPEAMSIDALIARLPAHSIVLRDGELPAGSRKGSTQTYAEVMAIWERLHTPFLAAADMQADPILKIEAYRATIAVDYACELAHQKLADVARYIARSQK